MRNSRKGRFCRTGDRGGGCLAGRGSRGDGRCFRNGRCRKGFRFFGLFFGEGCFLWPVVVFQDVFPRVHRFAGTDNVPDGSEQGRRFPFGRWRIGRDAVVGMGGGDGAEKGQREKDRLKSAQHKPGQDGCKTCMVVRKVLFRNRKSGCPGNIRQDNGVRGCRYPFGVGAPAGKSAWPVWHGEMPAGGFLPFPGRFRCR